MTKRESIQIGFEEWVGLPELNIPAIKAKIDSGAQTSALHAFKVETFYEDGVDKIKFGIHPIPERPDIAVYSTAQLIDNRRIVSSNGQVELRYVIRTLAEFGNQSWPIEITLTNRETMNYRMLLGRQAMEGRLSIAPEKSFLLGERSIDLYQHVETEQHQRFLNIAVLSPKVKSYTTNRFKSSAEKRGHRVDVLNPAHCYAEVSLSNLSARYQGKKLEQYDVIIPLIGDSDKIFPVAILRQFEALGVYPLNTSLGITSSNDKLMCHQLLSRGQIPMPTTAFGNYPGEAKDMIKIVGGAPILVKLLQNSHESEVIAETPKAASAVIQAFRTLKANFLVQEYNQERENGLVRCIVLGPKVIASVLRSIPKTESQDNLDHSYELKTIKINAAERKLAIRATRILGLRFAQVDLLRTENGPKVVEVDSSPNLQTIEKETKRDLCTKVIEYIEHYARPILPHPVIHRS